jgi:hypothetical protein
MPNKRNGPLFLIHNRGLFECFFQTPDDRLAIYTCDFFKMVPEILGKFEAVFDRGAFEAIDEPDREAYADLILQCLAPKFRYLLNGNEYEAGDYKGFLREQVFKLFQRNDPEKGEHSYFLSQKI